MRHCLLRWALMCVAATWGALSPCSAEASRIVVVQSGDSIDSLARKYHVSTKDIARANGISTEAVLIDGHKITIPDPPRSVRRSATMHASFAIKGDRITIRRGPDEQYRRITLLDNGAEVTATAKAGDWYQIQTPGGTNGWVRSDFLRPAGGSASSDSAPRIRRIARADDEDHPSARRSSSRKHHKETPSRQEKRRKRVTLIAERASARHRKARLASSKRHHERTRVARRHRGRPESDAPNADSDVVRTAYAYRGVPYHFGGSSRGGFDCSGFTRYVYGRKGVSLPHSAAEQFTHGKKVGTGHLKAGDLVFFHTTRSGISHVGIYAGSGKFVHASSAGGRVRVDNLSSGYYRNRFRGARRIK